MFNWINSARGQTLATSRSPLYLTQGVQDQPFPNNPLYRSEKVVSEGTKRLIYERATEGGQALKAIAAEMGLDVRRVAAIVRLKEAQKQWTEDVSSPKRLSLDTYLHFDSSFPSPNCCLHDDITFYKFFD